MTASSTALRAGEGDLQSRVAVCSPDRPQARAFALHALDSNSSDLSANSLRPLRAVEGPIRAAPKPGLLKHTRERRYRSSKDRGAFELQTRSAKRTQRCGCSRGEPCCLNASPGEAQCQAVGENARPTSRCGDPGISRTTHASQLHSQHH